MKRYTKSCAKPVIILTASLVACLILLTPTIGYSSDIESDNYGQWMKKPQSEWPQIAMINQIEYTDSRFPVAGCGFLLDTGDDILAVTAKHVLTYFKSETMETIWFEDTLKSWIMFPKNNPDDKVVIDSLINENHEESLGKIPSEKDWVLFTVKKRSENIQPLKFRTTPLKKGEPVYIIGWRYSDKDCPQVVYEGNFVEMDKGSFLISTRELADNTMPGLSGSPVIDSNGYLLGLMSQKAGKLERVSSLDYPKQLIAEGDVYDEINRVSD